MSSNSAFQAERRYIQSVIASREASEKKERMSTPAPVVVRMGELLEGDDVDDIQIGDLVLESSPLSIRNQVLNRWQP